MVERTGVGEGEPALGSSPCWLSGPLLEGAPTCWCSETRDMTKAPADAGHASAAPADRGYASNSHADRGPLLQGARPKWFVVDRDAPVSGDPTASMLTACPCCYMMSMMMVMMMTSRSRIRRASRISRKIWCSSRASSQHRSSGVP